MSYDFNVFKKQVFPEGDYNFKIKFCDVNAKTKEEKDCIKIKIEISHEEKTSTVDCIIPYSCTWIIEKLCNSIGHEEYYTQGIVSNNELLDKEGIAKITTETWNNKVSNKIKEFLPKEDEKELSSESTKESITEKSFQQDSDIPF